MSETQAGRTVSKLKIRTSQPTPSGIINTEFTIVIPTYVTRHEAGERSDLGKQTDLSAGDV